MALTPGTRLGPYVLQAFVGAGGMGEVSGRGLEAAAGGRGQDPAQFALGLLVYELLNEGRVSRDPAAGTVEGEA